MRSLLIGKLFDADGLPLVPTYAKKGDRRYRYYISQALRDKRTDMSQGWRLPAAPLEKIGIDALGSLFEDEARLLEVLEIEPKSVNLTHKILVRAKALSQRLTETNHQSGHGLLRDLIEGVQLEEGRLCILIVNRSVYRHLLLGPRQDAKAVRLELPVQFKRRGVELRLTIGNGHGPGTQTNPALIKAIAEAHQCFEALRNGRAQSISQLAECAGVHPADISRRITLAFLAPDIVEAILDGRQPTELTAKTLKRFRATISWNDQRQRLGFHE